jgi:hypothetical protein
MNRPDLLSTHALMFLLAVALLMCGHVVRAGRWALLLGRADQHGMRIRFTALAVGYVVNAVVPLRIGEWVRAWIFAEQTQSKLSHTLASIVVERAYDLIAIALLILFLSHFSVLANADLTAFTMLGVAAAVFAAIRAIWRYALMRKLIWHAANIFNPQIRFVLLDTAMALVEVERDVRAHALRFLLQSLGMWLTYIASYVAIAGALELKFATVMDFLFGNALSTPIIQMWIQGDPASLFITLYAVVPCVLVLAYEKFKFVARLRLGTAFEWLADPLLHLGMRAQDRFGDNVLYGDFLCRHFIGVTDSASDFEAHAIQDATVIRRLGGGSDAVTAVVRVSGELRFRKYALNGAAQKLHDQYQWLTEHRHRLPVVPLVESRMLDQRFLYDMPYSTASRDFYDFIHMTSLDRSWSILQDILERISAFHHSTRQPDADERVIARYIARKVEDNFLTIQQAFPKLFERETLRVNGREIAVSQIKTFATVNHLLPQIQSRRVSTIHGDLTIENIIFDSTSSDSWFLIDPNIGNVFESPLLDYAKLLQSLHLGYESLNRNHPCYVTEQGIEFFMPRTNVYEALFHQVGQWLKTRLGEAAYREIRLHEIVHYFRLIPYKIRKSPQSGMLFVGCLCLLIDRYNEEFAPC